jgi:hypothetical protein
MPFDLHPVDGEPHFADKATVFSVEIARFEKK